VPGHYSCAVVHGVPVPRPVRRRPRGVPADRPIRARARHVRASRARVRHGPEQVYVVVVPGGLHVGHHAMPSDHRQLFANAVPTIRTGTKPKGVLYLENIALRCLICKTFAICFAKQVQTVPSYKQY